MRDTELMQSCIEKQTNKKKTKKNNNTNVVLFLSIAEFHSKSFAHDMLSDLPCTIADSYLRIRHIFSTAMISKFE